MTNAEVTIQNAIDQFFFGRYASWKRSEDGVKIQWLPDGSDENWIPVKDWKDIPYTMGQGQLQSFAKFFYDLGRKEAQPKDGAEQTLFPTTAEPKKGIAPYVARRHDKGASSLGYVELSSIAAHYKIGIKDLKEILTNNNIPWGPFLKHSSIKSTHSLVSVIFLEKVHHAIINAL